MAENREHGTLVSVVVTYFLFTSVASGLLWLCGVPIWVTAGTITLFVAVHTSIMLLCGASFQYVIDSLAPPPFKRKL